LMMSMNGAKNQFFEVKTDAEITGRAG